MICPACGAPELKRDTRDVPFSYKGKTTVIHGLTGDFCEKCGDSLLLKTDGDRFAAEALQFRSRVDEQIARRSDDSGS
ncbi:type II toxin-antitoxin system MqsA family antitoxin [Burkholderia vietnamiensis]|uniref:type II toxin-antitoxin system MqsA family antitoxin n=1 Tax=Burkholderia vietnamiensis TaxID=60552 RepID=UPI001B93CAE5|nr:type II toxin-antitoxin system MqsA family antitoxin [Burkholderia vietnamiensis]MBR7973946.1 type II toxin-antitoxin system MqsA family antitoxin [Burkholderia vietnamiensis]